jgi:hypothetical protein
MARRKDSDMTGSLTKTFRRRLRRAPAGQQAVAETPATGGGEAAPIDIAPNDPLLAYLQSATGAVDVEALELDSPALAELKAAGVKLAVPLVSQGELIGVLNLGPRLSEQEYSSDDRKLLDNLAAQAAPALRVGQLVRQQQAEAATRQRFEQELEVAKLIQQNFLPKQLPELSGWQVAAYYRPAREVGGDFYDVIPLPEGKVGFVVGDVTDKGVPAALVMAATRSVLRASAQRLVNPGRRSSASTSTSARTCRRRCSSPACTACSTPRPATSASPTPVTTSRTSRPPTAPRSCAPAACRSASCPACPTRRRRPCCSPATRCCCTPTASSRRTAPTARCSASRGSSSASPTTPAAAS